MQARSRRVWLVLVSMFSVGCAGTQFDVRSEPSWPRAQHHFSTFAVQRDGVVSRQGWGALGPNVPGPFGAHHCDVAFGQTLFESAPELAEAIGSYVKANGVTDALLERVAPAAEGDTIMFIIMSGAPRVAADGGPNTVGMASGRGGGGGGRGGRRGGMGGGRGGMRQSAGEPHEGGDGLQIDATFYSIRERRSLAEIRMSYTGAHMDEAVRAFNVRLDQEFPGARCSGWTWKAPLDPVAIRQLPEQ